MNYKLSKERRREMSFSKNQDLENLLSKINTLLKPVEQERMESIDHNYETPCILQIGSPRSGSTLFTQWAASLGVFSGPTNFLSRFYEAPYLGALIYEMVTNPKYDYRDEFSDINKSHEFKSTTGKTTGFSAPHEFWYFWRKHFEFSDIPVDNETFSKTASFDTFNKELNLISMVFDKPFVMKAHIANWYLESFSKKMNNAVYVHIYRDPVANVRSLMKARVNRNNTVNEWFSFKPKEYLALINMDAYHQVAGQIYFSEKAILDQRSHLKDRYVMFSYEDFCDNPEEVFYSLIKKINQYSKKQIPLKYIGSKSFKVSSPKTEFDDGKIKAAIKYFEDKHGKLIYQ